MVRHKSRWLLVAVDSEENVKNLSPTTISNNNSNSNITGKDDPLRLADKNGLFHALRISMQDAFGIAVAGIIEDIQVRLYMPESKLALIKVPRDASDLVRSAITLLTKVNDEPIVATVISTNGSARTAKLATLRLIKRKFRNRVGVGNANVNVNVNDAIRIGKELRNLEDQLEIVRNIDG